MKRETVINLKIIKFLEYQAQTTKEEVKNPYNQPPKQSEDEDKSKWRKTVDYEQEESSAPVKKTYQQEQPKKEQIQISSPKESTKIDFTSKASDREEMKRVSIRNDDADELSAFKEISTTVEKDIDSGAFEDENYDFSVSQPKLVGDSIAYYVKGVDRSGKWEGQRRFSHFFALYEALIIRFPACFIPKIPPKKAIGNKEISFIKERRYYLERFLRKLSKYDYIIHSDEFQIFSRPAGEVDKLLARLPKMSSGSLLDRIRKAGDINERMFDAVEREKFNNATLDCTLFIKKVLPQLKAMKKTINNFKVIKESQIGNYKILYGVLDKYEELNMMSYLDRNASKLVITEPESKEIIKDQMSHMIDNLKNPYEDMYHWCKGEIYDLQALQVALTTREQVESQIKKMESKKKNTQADLENVNQGKKTIRTLLKSDKDTNGMLSTIENSEREIDNLQSLLEVISIHLGEIIIPKFKQEKIKVYQRIMQQFNIMEINNAHQTASFWSKVLSNPQLKNIAKLK
ncbi:px domain containing protein [Stylonychia lemnae]|uniref:Px domain containing protein n=1 Tax=Stylonychia lemnae TaxID=5949 RepID=A0A078B159_STYLE|nr:px domain containing protein [Stylonychia lemnae]|eukprot:CDW87092.1 px domain containing protein [Stylonychia lemnae]